MPWMAVVDTRMRMDNSYFQGKFSEGVQVSGKYSSADGSLEYDGQWKGDMRHGQGTFHLSGAYKYTGSWFENARHGQGKCVYFDGALYDGEWQSDERCAGSACTE